MCGATGRLRHPPRDAARLLARELVSAHARAPAPRARRRARRIHHIRGAARADPRHQRLSEIKEAVASAVSGERSGRSSSSGYAELTPERALTSSQSPPPMRAPARMRLSSRASRRTAHSPNFGRACSLVLGRVRRAPAMFRDGLRPTGRGRPGGNAETCCRDRSGIGRELVTALVCADRRCPCRSRWAVCPTTRT